MPTPETEDLATVPLPTPRPEPTVAAAAAPAGSGAGKTAPTAEPVSAAEPEPVAASKPRGRWWRGFTGSLAAGLAVLAVGVLVVAGICLFTGAPGPGAVLLIGHPIAAALALLAQREADRRTGVPALGAGFAVLLFTVSAFTLFWLT